MEKLKKAFIETKSKLIYPHLRKRIQKKNFTIISDNDWGGTVYRRLGMQYLSPFVGIKIYAPDYIELLQDLKHHVHSPLKFTLHSKYETTGNYPIGILDHKVEIHFVQEKYKQDALKKWNKRVKRIQWDHLYIKFSDQYACTSDCIEAFEKLPFERKVCFSAKPFPHLKHVIWFHNQPVQSNVENEYASYKEYFDLEEWLNTGKIYEVNEEQEINVNKWRTVFR